MAHRYASEAPKGSNARGGFVLEVEMVRGIRWMRETFDWWGGRAAGVPLGVGQRKQRIVCRYKEVLWTE